MRTFLLSPRKFVESLSCGKAVHIAPALKARTVRIWKLVVLIARNAFLKPENNLLFSAYPKAIFYMQKE
jgi:hypothetical protein